jgi:hypothetical protein
MEIYNTHRFLFTLNHENNIKGHIIIFIDRDNNEIKIELDKIEISSSPVSCKLYDKQGNRYIVPFIRIKEVYREGELVWTTKDQDTTSSKIIKGYD